MQPLETTTHKNTLPVSNINTNELTGVQSSKITENTTKKTGSIVCATQPSMREYSSQSSFHLQNITANVDSGQSPLTAAKTYFDNIQWRPQATKKTNLQINIGYKNASKIPAIQIKTQIAATADGIYQTMINSVDQFVHWLPSIEFMQTVATPNPQERILSMQTYKNIGISVRKTLAQGKFHVTDNQHTHIHLSQLPDDNPHYDDHPEFKNSKIKIFETFMTFSPSINKPGFVDLVYENHTDPNISQALMSLFINESINNHTTFVENCTLTLVNSPNNKPNNI